MIFKVNIDKLFGELEEKVIEEQRNIGEKSLEEEEELEKNYTIEEIQEEVVKNNDQEEKMEITPELQAEIEQAEADYRAGKCIVLETREDIDRYLDSL